MRWLSVFYEEGQDVPRGSIIFLLRRGCVEDPNGNDAKIRLHLILVSEALGFSHAFSFHERSQGEGCSFNARVSFHEKGSPFRCVLCLCSSCGTERSPSCCCHSHAENPFQNSFVRSRCQPASQSSSNGGSQSQSRGYLPPHVIHPGVLEQSYDTGRHHGHQCSAEYGRL